MPVCSLHVARTLASEGAGVYNEAGIYCNIGAAVGRDFSIAAQEYDTVYDIASALDTTFNAIGIGTGTVSINSDGYVTMTRAPQSWSPTWPKGNEYRAWRSLLWELLGFRPTIDTDSKTTHTASYHAHGSVWLDSLLLWGESGRVMASAQSIGALGHAKTVAISNQEKLKLKAENLTAEQANAVREWYGLAQRGNKVTLRVDGSDYEFVLDRGSLDGLDSVCKRSSVLYPHYQLSLDLRKYVS